MNLTQLMMAQAHVFNNNFVSQANQGFGPQPYANTPASRIRDFIRTNPPTFHGTKFEDYPQGFIDEFFKVVDAIGVTPREKAELDAYQLKDVAQVWFEQCMVERPLDRGLVYWEEFKGLS